MKQHRLLFAMLLIAVLSAVDVSAQNRTVRGSVIFAEDGSPAIGAYVTVEGTKIGAVTDLDGNFEITGVPASATHVVASFMGSKDSRAKISDKMRIVLESDSEFLAEAVVTGMQVIDRRLSSGAASKVNASDVKLDGMADISRSLEGRVAGVSVQNVSGTFGVAPKIRVRGATSIYGSSKPLWVVDGVIQEDVLDVSTDQLSSGDANTLISSAIAGLNADDIESFDILKDGSATSIYGARAMAGVIVVTTKKGKAGSTKLNYTGEFTTRLKPDYGTFNIMNSQDQMGIYQELQQKGYLNYAELSNASASGVFGKMYQLIGQYDATSGQFGLANTPAARAQYLRDAEYRNTDWFDLLFSNAVQQNHSVSISGGSDKGTYYASLSIMDDPGWYKQSGIKRYTANVNASYKFIDMLTFTLGSKASYRKQRAPGTLGRATDPVSGEVKRDFDINPYSYALNTSRALDPNETYTKNYAPFNIFDELENNYLDLDVFNISVQGEVKFQPIKQLSFSALGAVKYAGTSQEHYILDGANQAMAYREMSNTVIRNANPFLYSDPDKPYDLPVSVLPEGGIFEKQTNSMNGWDFRASGTFNETFARDHIVNVFAGMEINSIDRHATWNRDWGLLYEMGEVSNYDYRVFKRGSEENSPYYTLTNTRSRKAAFFGNAAYSYKGRYSINGTMRYEGTNELGKSRSARWLPTWNVSGKWTVSEENWMKGISNAISFLSLKASYSLTADRGPQSVSNSAVVIGSETPWRPSAGLRESSLYIADLANEDLTYEKKKELNLGLESGFIDNRINFTFDWYTRDNFSLIGVVNTQGIGGQVEKMGNTARMKSDGYEFDLTTHNIQNPNFKWTTSFIFSHMHNEVLELKTTVRTIDLVTGEGFAKEGYSRSSLFSIPFMGLNSQGLPTFKDQDGNVGTVTGVYFQESDPDKLDFLEYSGNAEPTDQGSFLNTFDFYGFHFNVFLTYSFGNVIRLDPVFRKSYNDLDAMPKEFKNRWTVPGDEKYTDIPVIASAWQNRQDTDLGIAYNSYNYSSARIARGDFIRMKELSLSYDFPKRWIEKIHFNSLSLKLQATNLFLLYADKKLNGQDPEFFNTGGVASPLAKQFTFTVRIGL